MSEAIAELIAAQLGKKIIRVSALALVAMLLGAVGSALYIDRHVSAWERTLGAMQKSSVRLNEFHEFATELKIQNPALNVPDDGQIVLKQRALEEHGAEKLIGQ